MQVLFQQGVHHAQHEGHVGVGAQRYPLGADVAGHVVVDGADADELHATVLRQLLPVGLFMASEAILADLRVLGGKAAEQHHELGVFGDDRP